MLRILVPAFCSQAKQLKLFFMSLSPSSLATVLPLVANPQDEWWRYNANAPLDHLVPWGNPLGTRVGWLWRPPRLSAIRHWYRCDRSRLADTSTLGRSWPDHSIPRIHFPLLRRCPSYSPWVGTAMVFDISIRPDICRRCKYRSVLDRPRTNC